MHLSPACSCHRYDDPNIALVSGSMLRDCMRDETLARLDTVEDLQLEPHVFGDWGSQKVFTHSY